MVERSPGGSSFAGSDLPETLPGNEGEAAVNVQPERPAGVRRRAFSRPAERPAFGGALLAPERAFPKTGQVVNLAGLTGREAAFPNASTGSGFRRIPNQKRRPFRAPGRAATATSKTCLCAFARSGLPRPGALPLSSVGCADPKNRRNSSDSAYGRRSPSGGSASFAFGSPWWASGGRPPRLRIPRGPRIAVRVLAGLSSAFNRPSLGRSAGRLNALPLVGITVSRHRASGFWGYPSTPLTALTGSQAPIQTAL